MKSKPLMYTMCSLTKTKLVVQVSVTVLYVVLVQLNVFLSVFINVFVSLESIVFVFGVVCDVLYVLVVVSVYISSPCANCVRYLVQSNSEMETKIKHTHKKKHRN